jgi:hypothetical protein
MLALAIGFVVEAPVPKPSPRTYPLFGLLALALIAGLLVARV